MTNIIKQRYLRINNQPYTSLSTPLDLFHNHSKFKVNMPIESWEMGFEVSLNQNNNQYIFKSICIEDGHIKNNHVSLHDLNGNILGKSIINYFSIGIGLMSPNETYEYLDEIYDNNSIIWDLDKK